MALSSIEKSWITQAEKEEILTATVAIVYGFIEEYCHTASIVLLTGHFLSGFMGEYTHTYTLLNLP